MVKTLLVLPVTVFMWAAADKEGKEIGGGGGLGLVFIDDVLHLPFPTYGEALSGLASDVM